MTLRLALGLPLQDMEGVVTRKKRRTVHKASVRAISGATLEVLQKRRQEKPEQRKLQREEAVRCGAGWH